VWVAERGRRVIGLIVLMGDGEQPEIRSVAVLPAFQRQGIGRALMNHVETLARTAGHVSVQLYTNAKLPELVTYYVRLGYVAGERRVDHGYDRVFMTKRLD